MNEWVKWMNEWMKTEKQNRFALNLSINAPDCIIKARSEDICIMFSVFSERGKTHAHHIGWFNISLRKFNWSHFFMHKARKWVKKWARQRATEKIQSSFIIRFQIIGRLPESSNTCQFENSRKTSNSISTYFYLMLLPLETSCKSICWKAKKKMVVN